MDHDFLTIDDVLQIHADQIRRYGGSPEIRDSGLLSSAVETPALSIDGVPLHTDLVEMAAAYLFHIVMNHPFIDGNKRTGTASAIVFLDLNGIELDVPQDDLASFVITLAQGGVSKAEVNAFLRRYIHE